MQTRLVLEPAAEVDIPLECEVDSGRGEMRYALPRGGVRPLALRGFAPPGWCAPVKALLEPPTGVLPLSAPDVANLLDGLGWIETGNGHGLTRLVRAQPQPPAFEPARDATTLIGVCSRRLTITGIFDEVPVSLQPAIVAIVRTPAEPASGRLRAMHLAVDVSCGGAQVPGVGEVAVEVFTGPGAVVARTLDADFPADMLLTIRMLFHTPLGPITGGLEHYVGAGIPRFPPFGVELRPVRDRVDLTDGTGRPIGELLLGPLVPLFHAGAEGVPRAMPCRA